MSETHGYHTVAYATAMSHYRYIASNDTMLGELLVSKGTTYPENKSYNFINNFGFKVLNQSCFESTEA